MQEIEADWGTLLRQAPMTIHDYMLQAAASIDGQFGSGYAAKNPALVAAFIQACAADFHSTSIGIAAQKVRNAIGDAAQSLSGIWTPNQ